MPGLNNRRGDRFAPGKFATGETEEINQEWKVDGFAFVNQRYRELALQEYFKLPNGPIGIVNYAEVRDVLKLTDEQRQQIIHRIDHVNMHAGRRYWSSLY
jgi:hypothetical protein